MSITQLAGIAVDFFAKPARRRRYTTRGRQPNGTFQPGPADITDIMATIQAPSERDLRELPEGERTEAYVTIWTRADLRTSDESTGLPADEVENALGESFKVHRVMSRTDGGFTRAIGRLIDDRGRRV